MMKQIHSVVVLVAVLAGVTGCRDGREPAQQTLVNQYVLKIEGTAGLKVDLLVIAKPTVDSLERLIDEEVVLPYSKEFEGVKCAIWLDAPYKGQDGDYKMSLTTKGVGTSSESGFVKGGSRCTGALHDL